MYQQPTNAKEKIKHAFIKLYKKKEINEITINNLTETAGVYRGTFYYHYPDIYALLEDVKNDVKANFQQNLIPLLPAFLTNPSSENHFRPIEEFYEKNEDLVRLFLITKPDIQLFNYANGILRNALLEIFQLTDKELPDKFYYMLEFTVSGQIALLRKWFEEERSLSSNDFSSVIKTCTYGFITYLKQLGLEPDN